MEAKLFGSRISPFVEKVARALQMKRVPFTLVAPRSPGDFKRWNPQTRKMPAVEIGGQRLFDSPLIPRRLDQPVPEPPVPGPGAAGAAPPRVLRGWADQAPSSYAMARRRAHPDTN